MINEQYKTIEDIIKTRRSVNWAKMNGKMIPDQQVKQLLHLAHWAPTHGRTEPWQFFVYTGEALKAFGRSHADLYWNNTPEENRTQATADKLTNNVNMTSHLIIAVMKRGHNEKIPMHEELAAASAGAVRGGMLVPAIGAVFVIHIGHRDGSINDLLG